MACTIRLMVSIISTKLVQSFSNWHELENRSICTLGKDSVAFHSSIKCKLAKARSLNWLGFHMTSMLTEHPQHVHDLLALFDISLQSFDFDLEAIDFIFNIVLLEHPLDFAFDLLVLACVLVLACFLGRSVILVPITQLEAIALSDICLFDIALNSVARGDGCSMSRVDSCEKQLRTR